MYITGILNRKNKESEYQLFVTESKISAEKFSYRKENQVFLAYENLLGIAYKKFNFFEKRKTIERKKESFVLSAMLNLSNKNFEIYPSGNYSDPENLMLMDDWKNIKMLQTLPLDYQPEY